MTKMDVSVIIVNYNTRQITADCIDSVFAKTTGVDFEVILVDNASTDGSKEQFEDDSRIAYIYNKENVGFGRANNIGYERARGKYIFLLNSDTILLNNAILLFYEKMEDLPGNVACLGTVLKDKDGRPGHSYGEFLQWKLLLPWCKAEEKTENIPGNGLEVMYVLGADMFLRRSVIERCGLFDPVFFMYNEENDLQRRYHDAGYLSKIISEPQIIHLGGKSNKNKINVQTIEGNFVYMRKWLSRPSYVLYRICFALTRLPNVVLAKAPMFERINYLRVLLGLYRR